MKKFITLLAIATLLSCQSETSQLSIDEFLKALYDIN